MPSEERSGKRKKSTNQDALRATSMVRQRNSKPGAVKVSRLSGLSGFQVRHPIRHDTSEQERRQEWVEDDESERKKQKKEIARKRGKKPAEPQEDEETLEHEPEESEQSSSEESSTERADQGLIQPSRFVRKWHGGGGVGGKVLAPPSKLFAARYPLPKETSKEREKRELKEREDFEDEQRWDREKGKKPGKTPGQGKKPGKKPTDPPQKPVSDDDRLKEQLTELLKKLEPSDANLSNVNLSRALFSPEIVDFSEEGYHSFNKRLLDLRNALKPFEGQPEQEGKQFSIWYHLNPTKPEAEFQRDLQALETSRVRNVRLRALLAPIVKKYPQKSHEQLIEALSTSDMMAISAKGDKIFNERLKSLRAALMAGPHERQGTAFSVSDLLDPGLSKKRFDERLDELRDELRPQARPRDTRPRDRRKPPPSRDSTQSSSPFGPEDSPFPRGRSPFVPDASPFPRGRSPFLPDDSDQRQLDLEREEQRAAYARQLNEQYEEENAPLAKPEETFKFIKGKASKETKLQLTNALTELRLDGNRKILGKKLLDYSRVDEVHQTLEDLATPTNQKQFLSILDLKFLGKGTDPKQFQDKLAELRSGIRMAPILNAMTIAELSRDNQLATALGYLQTRPKLEDIMRRRINRLSNLEMHSEVADQMNLLKYLKFLTSETDNVAFNARMRELASMLKSFETPEIDSLVKKRDENGDVIEEIDFTENIGKQLREFLIRVDQLMTLVATPERKERLRGEIQLILRKYQSNESISDYINQKYIASIQKRYVPAPRYVRPPAVGGIETSQYETMLLSLVRTLSTVFDPQDVADVALDLKDHPSLVTFARLMPTGRQLQAKKDLQRLDLFLRKNQTFDDRHIATLVKHAGSDTFERGFAAYKQFPN
jgi:hypothetical protein